MQYGVCTSLENAAHFAQAGFDFLELNVQQFLQGEAEESAFLAGCEKVQNSPLPPRAANCFIPGNLKITGPDVNPERLQSYVETVCRRAAHSGISTIVFGSGDARRIPDAFSRIEAWGQIVNFGRRAAAVAARHGVVIVAEPLNQTESNVLNTVQESADFVREVGHPHLRLLVDSFHWWRDDNDEKALRQSCGLLRHVHVATGAHRLAPGEEPSNFDRFFKLLGEGGYQGPISIEATWKDPAGSAARAREILSTK